MGGAGGRPEVGNCPAHTREAGRGPQGEESRISVQRRPELEGDRAGGLAGNDICGTSTLVFT